ncbi:MAG TPA: hypothetical protein VN900_00680 [Stellaceae bacterium]|nr:hypothetical protein [Stellaceae bacterium]
MRFFRRTEITIRCACRGTTLAVPDRDSLLDTCEQGQRRRLQHCLAKRPADAPSWAVQWGKSAGDALRPQDVVAVLHREDIIVELAYAQRGILAEMLVAQGERVAAGTQLARLERRAKAIPPPPTKDILRQYVERQRRDAETIKHLEAALAQHQQLSDRLQGEILMLRTRQTPGTAEVFELKFKRLKHEFSKRFHPDARPPGDAERERRALVFQEFWPIVEKIERS